MLKKMFGSKKDQKLEVKTTENTSTPEGSSLATRQISSLPEVAQNQAKMQQTSSPIDQDEVKWGEGKRVLGKAKRRCIFRIPKRSNDQHCSIV